MNRVAELAARSPKLAAASLEITRDIVKGQQAAIRELKRLIARIKRVADNGQEMPLSRLQRIRELIAKSKESE